MISSSEGGGATAGAMVAGRSIDRGTLRDAFAGTDLGTLCWDLMALASGEEHQVAGHRRHLERLVDRVRTSQWDEGRGCPRTHPYYGGTGRDQRSAPDLTHTAHSLQALRLAGIPESDPFVRRAVMFISRCQSHGRSPHPRSGDGDPDAGGFAPVPGSKVPQVEGPAYPGSTTPNPSRPSGAATCMGITSLLAAGIPPEDQRMQGALRWLREHYSLDSHPGMARANEGLYRYYYEFARAMRALGQDQLRDARGVVHDWRGELARTLATRQRPDGSWTNPEESPERAWCTPVTTTVFALLTLDQIRSR